MSDNEQPHPEKKVTAATTDAPQEEFINPESVPSKSDADMEQKKKADENAPPPPLEEIIREAPPRRSDDK